MKLKWSELREAVMGAFDLLNRDPSLTATTVERFLYQIYRVTVPERVPDGTAKKLKFKELVGNWDRQARAFASPLRPILPALNATQVAKVKSYRQSLLDNARAYQSGSESESESGSESGYDGGSDTDEDNDDSYELEDVVKSPAPKHHFPTKLQFEKDGKTAQDYTAPAGQKIDAILCSVAPNAPMHSRLSVVVQPQCAGQPLLRKLQALAVTLKHVGSSSSGAISEFKVMSPELGSDGPESAVIYLSHSLEDAKVKHLIMQLCSFLYDDLMTLIICPVGMIQLAKGIYGCDLPGSDLEKKAVGHSVLGSAGELFAAIISKAAWEAHCSLYRRKDSAQIRAKLNSEKDTEEFVKGKLRAVLGHLKWQLVD
jgi:hypothetical protein